MKKLALLTLIFNLTTNSFATETLSCWKKNFKQAKTPFMTATIVNSTTLSNVRFLYRNSAFKDAKKIIHGKLNTNNRSPYKGNMDYIVKDNFFITLPKNLSNKNLKAIEPKGIGMWGDENGYIQSLDSEQEVCDSYCTYPTVRLSCRSTL